MEYKNPAKPIPKGAPFKIPIKTFESEINNKSSKSKQKEILELLTNHNEISSYKEYQKIERMMQRACSQGDLELLEIYLNEEVKFEIEKELISFKINKKTKTASLFRVFTLNNKLIIPRTIKYEMEDYLITSVISSGERIKIVKNIEFSKDSEVRIIYEKSFYFSNVNSISFPASLIELKEGWCCQTQKLTSISISPLNDRFMFKEDKSLIGKSDIKSDNFDILHFASRDITKINIPSNIKIISSYAFDHCKKLKEIEIPNDSNLEQIGKYAFASTYINQINIPSKVINIKRKAFFFCHKLSKVEIPINSKLQIIDDSLFEYTNIKKIYIPSNVLMICESSFYKCYKLSNVEIPTDSKLQTIENFAFSRTNIRQIYIPSNVSNINIDAFKFCNNLQIFEISEESKLEFLDKAIFLTCKNVIIMIPQKIQKLISSNQ